MENIFKKTKKPLKTPSLRTRMYYDITISTSLNCWLLLLLIWSWLTLLSCVWWTVNCIRVYLEVDVDVLVKCPVWWTYRLILITRHDEMARYSVDH